MNGFWSLMLYNDKCLFHPNDLERYSLGSKNKNLKRTADSGTPQKFLVTAATAKATATTLRVQARSTARLESTKDILRFRAYWLS